MCSRTQHFRTLARSLHVSSASRHLVGPNDPISNLRPIIYTDVPCTPSPAEGRPESHVNHPYSLNEFTDAQAQHDHTLELQYKLAREQLDTFNHNYWTDVCRDTSVFTRCRIGALITTTTRATRGSKQPSILFWRLFPNLLYPKRVKMRSQSSTRSG